MNDTNEEAVLFIPDVAACPVCLSEDLERYPMKDGVTCCCSDCSTHFTVAGVWRFPEMPL